MSKHHELSWITTAADRFTAEGVETLEAWRMAFDLMREHGTASNPREVADADIVLWRESSKRVQLSLFRNPYSLNA